MSRSRRGGGRRKKGGGGIDTRSAAEKETDEIKFIDARRNDGDPASSLHLSSLLFSHHTIYLQPSQVATKIDGTLGFYTLLEHFPDPEPPTEPTDPAAAPPPTIPPSVGFVQARTCFNPKSACLHNEITMLNEKIDELDTEFQTIKVNLDFDGENMSESDKAEQMFKSRDLSRALAVERSSVEALKEQLEVEKDKGMAVVYSTACTEGRVLTVDDVIEFFIPPDDETLEAERKDVEWLAEEERKRMEEKKLLCLSMNKEMEEDWLAIARLNTSKGTVQARLQHRLGARWLDSF